MKAQIGSLERSEWGTAGFISNRRNQSKDENDLQKYVLNKPFTSFLVTAELNLGLELMPFGL